MTKEEREYTRSDGLSGKWPPLTQEMVDDCIPSTMVIETLRREMDLEAFRVTDAKMTPKYDTVGDVIDALQQFDRSLPIAGTWEGITPKINSIYLNDKLVDQCGNPMPPTVLINVE
jgi:hypothetical protein